MVVCRMTGQVRRLGWKDEVSAGLAWGDGVGRWRSEGRVVGI